MSTTIRFPSIGRGAELRLRSPLVQLPVRLPGRRAVPRHRAWLGVYQTYGDGSVQHSPDGCAPVCMMGDALASLTTFLLDPRNTEAQEIAANHWRGIDPYNERTRRATILKARGIRHRDGKTRYVMARDLSFSSVNSKRHDRRWHQIVPWMDGTVSSTFSLLYLDSGGVYGLERYLVLKRVIDAFSDADGSYCGKAEDQFDPFKRQHLDDAFCAFESLMLAYHHRRMIEPLLGNYGRDVARSAATARTA